MLGARCCPLRGLPGVQAGGETLGLPQGCQGAGWNELESQAGWGEFLAG